MKKAIIFGATGQDGSYLIELLLSKGYEVHGVMRRCSVFNTQRIDHLIKSEVFNKVFFLHYGDVTDALNVNNLINKIKPDEIYNLAAQSHVQVSFELPQYTAMVDGIGTLNILEAARINYPKAKIYQASTSEMYGGVGYNMPETGYTEDSKFHPRSPYGCAKIYAYWITRNYREAYDMYACNGLLFNHESAKRGDTFVTKKITNWMRKFKLSYKIPALELGNLNAKRDWGHAKDYVNAMHLILQQDKPQDYVIATGETYSVKDFINECLLQLNLIDKFEWIGQGVNEMLVWKNTDNPVIIVNPKYFRPSEVDVLLGDPSKAKKELGWVPEYTFKKLVEEMLNA